MSLVNDMLRDLNKRTPVSNQAARVHGAIQSSIESKRPRVRVGLVLAGGLLAGLLGGYFYFESMGVQVVQVPLARVPTPSTPVQPQVEQTVTEAPPVAAPPATETASATTPAIESVAEIRELALQPNGFTLLIEVSEAATFDVRDRSAFGLTLHIDGVDRYDRAGTTVPGMSLLVVSDGLDIGIELNEAADFLVREDTETDAFDILLSASYRPELTSEEMPATEPPASAIEVVRNDTPPVPQTNLSPPQTSGVMPSSPRTTPGRVNRELSLEDRDRNNSQSAVMILQGGRMVEAYDQLRLFLAENPSAHQSRETLATLLLAQREYAQAGAVIDEGLALAPNYGSFKKIKARLLIQDNDSAGALALLRAVPPAVTADSEYHELLASLYQQGNDHVQAVTTYQDLLRTNPEQGRWWAGLGISLDAQDKDADALTSYQAALQTESLDANLRQYIQNRISNLSGPQ